MIGTIIMLTFTAILLCRAKRIVLFLGKKREEMGSVRGKNMNQAKVWGKQVTPGKYLGIKTTWKGGSEHDDAAYCTFLKMRLEQSF